ncbi:MAG TPA: RNA polymerase sigma factor, partial [Gaiellaceae bacterium]
MAVTESGHLASREIDDLYRAHVAEVYRYAYAVLGNHADAEDVTQTTFLNAYRSLEQGVRPRKPTNWLLTIASNAIKQRFRQEQSRPRQVEFD